jgi:excisionase family DNA binding protein
MLFAPTFQVQDLLTGGNSDDRFRSMRSKRLSTVEVAAAIGVPRATLQYWIKQRKIAAPKVGLCSGVAVRLWAVADVEKARELKGTLKPGPKKK